MDFAEKVLEESKTLECLVFGMDKKPSEEQIESYRTLIYSAFLYKAGSVKMGFCGCKCTKNVSENGV